MVADIVIVAIVSAVSGAIGVIGKTWLDGKKQKNDANLSANDQALLIYKGLLETLQKQVSDLQTYQNKLELEFLAARENSVELRTKNQFLKEKISDLEKLITELEEEIKVLKSKT